jgi:oxalate decarboxylase/phosphoglucose isomerase-like protein (cupin superfamily)
MTNGMTLLPGAGQAISAAGMTLKVGAAQTPTWSAFETRVAPGFDVGAHVHAAAEEIFYVLDGELDLLAFEPVARTATDWSGWESAAGQRVVRAGPGSLMFVPAGCPHAFANRGQLPARMLFLVAPAGHEHYLGELGQLMRGGQAAGGQPPTPEAVAALRARHDIHQITPLIPGSVTSARPGGNG